MNRIRVAVYAALIAMPTMALAADDALNCDTVNFGADVVAQFPKIKDACQGVTKKGTEDTVYVRLAATVHAANKENLVLDFKGRDGKPISRITVVPSAEQKIRMDGKEVKFSSLEKGSTLDLYVTHNKWGLYSDLDGSLVKVLSREEL